MAAGVARGAGCTVTTGPAARGTPRVAGECAHRRSALRCIGRCAPPPLACISAYRHSDAPTPTVTSVSGLIGRPSSRVYLRTGGSGRRGGSCRRRAASAHRASWRPPPTLAPRVFTTAADPAPARPTRSPLRDRVHEWRVARAAAVLVVVLVDGADHGVLDEARRLPVREALTQVHSARLRRERRELHGGVAASVSLSGPGPLL